MTLGFIVSTVGLVIGQWPAFWAGVAIVAVGAVVSGIMKAAGLGKKTQHAS